MNFYEQSTEYIVSLRQKGFCDNGFYTEYDFICLEVYKHNHPEALEQVNNLQEQALLCRESLR